MDQSEARIHILAKYLKKNSYLEQKMDENEDEKLKCFPYFLLIFDP